MVPLTINPQPLPRDWKWQEDRYLYTFKGALTIQHFFDACKRATSIRLVAWALAVEDTSEEVDGVWQVGYVHSHVAAIFKTRLNLKGARKFDVFVDDPDDPNGLPTQVHPHVQPKITMVQMETVFTSYLAGRKYDVKAGKVVFKAPVHYESYVPPEWSWQRSITEEILNAETLVESCLIAEVRPKTVNDIKILRDESAATSGKRFRHLFNPDTFRRDIMPENWVTQAGAAWGVVWLFGGSGLGKTKFAVAQFKNPFLQKPFDSVGCLENMLRRFDPRVHDGIVLDEVDLRCFSRQQVIALFDLDEPATFDVRYRSYELPAGVRKILISNPPPVGLLVNDEYGAIARRYQAVQITAPTWHVTVSPAQHTQATTPVIHLLTPPTQPN